MDESDLSSGQAGEESEKVGDVPEGAQSKPGNDAAVAVPENQSTLPSSKSHEISRFEDMFKLFRILQSTGKLDELLDEFAALQDPWVAYKKKRETEIGKYVIEDDGSPFPGSKTKLTGKPIVFTTLQPLRGGSQDVTITINSPELVKLMEKVMHPLLVHEGIKLWENKPPVEIKASNVLLAHSFENLSKASSEEAATDAHKQLYSLLEHLNEYERQTANARAMIKQEHRVNYDKVWTLFPPGRRIVARSAFDALQIFTVYRHSPGDGGMVINCWAYDWDGARLVRKVYHFVILKFFGSMHIRELPCYPFEFYDEDGKTPKDLLEQLSERGKRFARLCISSEASQGYRRPILTCDKYHTPLASEETIDLYNRSGNEKLQTNLVRTNIKWLDSFPGFKTRHNIVVDAAMYKRYAPGNDLHIGEKLHPVIEHRCSCEMCNPNGLRETFEKDFLEQTEFAGAGVLGKAADESNDDLDVFYAMLPGRLLGYIVDRKQWAQIPIDCIHDEDTTMSGNKDDTWDKLALREKEKGELKTIVEKHFQRIHEEEHRIHDLMRGKGEGLVLLLHGIPGVGKTMTAEALARKLGRYLIRIEASDFRYNDPGQVSEVFGRFFTLAHSWGALVLLDEADVFLQHRERQDLGQNALVSVLLRQLEYFQGVLITTTNRILSIDYAVQSRINYAINFRHLSKEEIQTVWGTFYSQLNERNSASRDELDEWFKTTGLDDIQSASFTGRDIRNLFTTAQLLKWPVLEKRSLHELFKTGREFRKQMEHANMDYAAKNTAEKPKYRE